MPVRPHRRFIARVRAAVGSDAAGLRQSLAATLVSSGGDLVAGLTLASISDTLELLPGLVVLVPAAIGMRGNIFGALGSRFGTSIHTGTFRLSRRRSTEVGQNIWASIVLSLSISLVLAVLAKVMATAFGVEDAISVIDFLVISIIGGMVSSIVVLALTIGVAALAVRRGWDMDNVAAPLVTAAGDIVTLPALFLATKLVGITYVTGGLAMAATALALVALFMGLRSKLPVLSRIVRESLPVLVAAGVIDIVAGLTIEGQLTSFAKYAALLVLIPPFLEDTGALGSVLASRLASKLHLGIIDPVARPQRPARDDFAIIALLAIPVFSLVGLAADLASWLTGQASPGALNMVGIALIGGCLATAMAMLVAYYGSVVTYRLGLDPDNYGVPIMTSSMDLIGVVSLILAISALRIS